MLIEAPSSFLPEVGLDAGRDITLSSAQDTEKEQSRSSGNQFSLGVGFS
ncbi:hemagglutinin repeat-containing protein, partial [Lonsdalea quercina]